ncbi:hypothetical protein C8J56DRAFT_1068472 [Mycena floridula]|nr:hypothetical protein C8J56DRAFT_1068472 [Mycena floridula]
MFFYLGKILTHLTGRAETISKPLLPDCLKATAKIGIIRSNPHPFFRLENKKMCKFRQVQNNYSKCGHSVREGTSPTNGRRPKLQFRFLVWIDSANSARPIHQIADQIAQRLVGNTANSQSNIIRC